MKLLDVRHSGMRSHHALAFGLVGLLLTASGCATGKSGISLASPTLDSKEIASQDSKVPPAGSVVRSQHGEISIRGVKLQHTQFDYPITINSKVEQWVDYFLGRGRPHMEKYLERSEHFIPFIAPILKQNNMPEDLVYLAMIESGFANHAHSFAKAVGPWQFISATGKRYGLAVNWWIDERRDTRKSTLAAVEYLKDLYSIFKNWELAASAYNAGEAKIARAIQRYSTKDFWELSRHRYLRIETRDYVPKIIAAALVAKNRTQFGFLASTLKAEKGEVLAADGEVVKVEKSTTEANQVQVAGTDKTETLASILKDDDAITAAEEELPAAQVLPTAALDPSIPMARPVATPWVSKKGEVGGEDLAEIEVQSPADLLNIANAAGLSYNTVKSLNPDILRWCTPPTVSTYRIKLPVSVKDKFLEAYNHQNFPRKVDFLAYKVKRGESLSGIARHFGIKVDPMSDLNGVSAKMPLRNGTRVWLPIPNDRTRSLATLEVRDAPESRRVRKGRRSRNGSRISSRRRQSARSKSLAEDLEG